LRRTPGSQTSKPNPDRPQQRLTREQRAEIPEAPEDTMKALIKTITANPTATAARTFAAGYLSFAVYQSFSHITQLFTRWGASDAWTMPLMIDSLMLLGKMIRSPKLAKSTRWVGLALYVFGALASLTANILAGDTFGDRAKGVVTICGLLVVEWVCDHIKPVQVDDAAAKADAKAAAIAKAKATRAANKAAAAAEQAEKDRVAAERREARRIAAEKREAERKAAADALAAEIERMQDDDYPVAPISPAVGYAGSCRTTYL
jgi:hypothetical protein